MAEDYDWERLRRYAWKEAWKWMPYGSNDRREELVSIAREHLLMVLNKFKPEGRASFYTWAYKVMENRIVDELRKSSREWKTLER